jgi:hypothetical protein
MLDLLIASQAKSNITTHYFRREGVIKEKMWVKHTANTFSVNAELV